MQRLIAHGRPRGRAQAGLDAGRGVRRRRRRRGELRPRRPDVRAPPRRAGRGRRARPQLRDPGALRVRLSPVLTGLGTYPFVRLDEAKAAAARARRADDRLRRRRAARGDAAVHPPRRGRGGRGRAGRRLPEGRRACRSCARRSPTWVARRFGAALDPDDRDRADARLEGGDLRPRPGRRRPGRAGRGDDARLPRARARRAVRRARRSSSCGSRRRTAGCPTSTPSTGTASRSCG